MLVGEIESNKRERKREREKEEMSGSIRRCSFQEEITICVVLVPVWTDDTKFARMANLLRRFDTVNLQEIIRSGSPWVKGTLRIRYVDYAVNQADAAWDVFQGYRNVLGVSFSFLLIKEVSCFILTFFFLSFSFLGHWYWRLQRRR